LKKTKNIHKFFVLLFATRFHFEICKKCDLKTKQTYEYLCVFQVHSFLVQELVHKFRQFVQINIFWKSTDFPIPTQGCGCPQKKLWENAYATERCTCTVWDMVMRP